MNTFKATCPSCNSSLDVPNHYLNQSIKCGSCAVEFTANKEAINRRPHPQQTQVKSKSTVSDKIIMIAGILIVVSILCMFFFSWKFLYLAILFFSVCVAAAPDQSGILNSIKAGLVCSIVGMGVVYFFSSNVSESKRKDKAKAERLAKSRARNQEEVNSDSSKGYYDTKSNSPSHFVLSDTSQEGIKLNMREYGAQEIAIKEKGDTINLVIQVPFGTSESKAKSMCDNFLRMVMSLSNDNAQPQKKIGKSSFSYHIGAITSDSKWVAQGYKGATSQSIYW